MACLLGDATAKSLGRVTFNPLNYIDPFGTVLLPAFLVLSSVRFFFNWTKTIPVYIRQLKNPRRDLAFIVAAGRTTNRALVWASVIAAHLLVLLPHDAAILVASSLERSIQIKLLLVVLNKLPLLPLDSGRMAIGILSDRLAYPLARLEKFELFILIVVLFSVSMISSWLGLEFDLLGVLIGELVTWLENALFAVTGHR